jgi:hypothetical protein
MPPSPRSKADANGPLTGGPFACLRAIHAHCGDHSIARCLISCARQRIGRVERHSTSTIVPCGSAGLKLIRPPAASSRILREALRDGPRRDEHQDQPRHADAIVTDPERGLTSLASELDRDRTRLGHA